MDWPGRPSLIASGPMEQARPGLGIMTARTRCVATGELSMPSGLETRTVGRDPGSRSALLAPRRAVSQDSASDAMCPLFSNRMQHRQEVRPAERPLGLWETQARRHVSSRSTWPVTASSARHARWAVAAASPDVKPNVSRGGGEGGRGCPSKSQARRCGLLAGCRASRHVGLRQTKAVHSPGPHVA